MRQAAPRRGELPASRAAEEAVIAAAMLDDETVIREGVIAMLKPEDFFWEENRLVWAAIEELAGARTPITIPTVAYMLSEMGAIDRLDSLVMKAGTGGAEEFLVVVAGEHFTAIGSIAHARMVKDYSERREQINRGAKMVREGYQGQTKPGWVK